jgi:hypothetical protein
VLAETKSRSFWTGLVLAFRLGDGSGGPDYLGVKSDVVKKIPQVGYPAQLAALCRCLARLLRAHQASSPATTRNGTAAMAATTRVDMTSRTVTVMSS